jgi:hypothetical protein
MDFLLSSTQGPTGPDPRPAVVSPSTAARDPEAKPGVVEPKPVDRDLAPGRRHDHGPRRAEQRGHRGERGRSHVQQALHHVVRDIRHAIRDEVNAGVEADELDLETMDSIRDLQRDFRRDLHDVFLQAGQQGGIERQQVLEGMIEALQSLAAGLRELTGADAAETEPKPDAVPAELTPVNTPGSLVDLSA